MKNQISSLSSSFLKNKAAACFLILFFILISIFGSKFHHALRNSSRYLLPVLQTADPQLFPNDSVVSALKKFRSLFYDSLAFGVKSAGISPENVKQVVHILYALFKILFILLLYYLAQEFRQGFWFFIIIATWTSLPQSVPVGNIVLFKPLITHETVVLVLGTAALIFLFQKRFFLFWLCIGISIFFHSLMAFHLFLITAPPLLVLDRKNWKKHASGMIPLLICSLLYVLFMSPPGLSGEEGALFMLEKGTCKHVSPFNQNLYGWVWMAAFMATALVAAHKELRKNQNAQWLIRFVIWGIPAGMILSLGAAVTQLPLLGLLQPMRVFLWITFLTFILISGGASHSKEKDFWAFILLMGVVGFSILDSRWALVFMGVYWFYSMFKKKWIKLSLFLPLSLDQFMRLGLGIGVMGMVLVWKPGWGPSHSPLPIGVGILLLLMTLPPLRRAFLKKVLILLLLAYCVLTVSFLRHDYFERKTDKNWNEVRLWCRNHTQKNDTFITPPQGNNFRILSWRTTLNEDMIHLVWVDPSLYEKIHQKAEEVQKGLVRSTWDLNILFSLAEKWDADYVLIRGNYIPRIYLPVFESGPYKLFEVTEPGASSN